MKLTDVARRIFPKVQQKISRGKVAEKWAIRLVVNAYRKGTDERAEYTENAEHYYARAILRIIMPWVKPPVEEPEIQAELALSDTEAPPPAGARLVLRNGRRFYIYAQQFEFADALRNLKKNMLMRQNGAKGEQHWRRIINERWPGVLDQDGTNQKAAQ